MSLRVLLAAVVLSITSACTYWQKDRLTGLDHPSGWADQIRSAAVEAYPYAQMSNNAYADSSAYDLGPEFTNCKSMPNDRLGFAYSTCERRKDGQLREVIIAFRGTEGFVSKDMLCGNLLGCQNKEGLQAYKRIREAYPSSVDVNVTGHSLGGAIATYVSLREPNVKSYIFNNSPRFNAHGPIPDNRRLAIVERGEILKVLRGPGREAPQTYVSINCTRGFGPLRQHSIRRLADCLTQIAAWQDDSAKASLGRNPSIPWPANLPHS